MSLDAMKQALEVLEEAVFYTSSESWSPSMTQECEAAITALRAAIKEAQGPVAWMHNFIADNVITHRPADIDRHPERWAALYTAPPPCPTCEALARSVMMDQTSHDMAPRRWQRLTEEEPVAWMHPSWIDPDTRGWASDSFNAIPIEGWAPVYTAPRQWQELTKEEIKDCEKQAMVNGSLPFEQRFFFARAIEAKLKEKNNE